MPNALKKKVVTVKSHPMKVPANSKNPTGLTIRDTHLRRLPGTYLNNEEIVETFKNANLSEITLPAAGKIKEFKNADKYDELIGFWTQYFNEKLKTNPALDPDVFKALIASESGFRLDPSENKIAIGITQITKKTWKIVQDPKGESKNFIFRNVMQKDLKKPEIAIPIGIRWLQYKSERAGAKLGRPPTHEEIILEYKGLLKSKNTYKKNAIESYRKYYGQLKKK